MKNIGIVTTWFDRGASYVSKQFENVLSQQYNVFIYARGGEKHAIGDSYWDKKNVTWGKRRNSPFSMTLVSKRDFIKWLKKNHIDIVLFNEQEWWYPILWCNELAIPTICYVDYYKKNTIPFFAAYSSLVCNTKRHFSAFNWHTNSFFFPWGTNCKLFIPRDNNFNLVHEGIITFFHSCGMNPYRKGTDIILNAAEKITDAFKLIIHSQIDLRSYYDEDTNRTIDRLEDSGKLEIITKTVQAPGLYHMGDVYLYPSRLEGIGLTIAEAEACGLVPVVTNNGPMNEFVSDSISYLIEVSNFYSREDGYFWPECTPDVNNLRNHMTSIINDKTKTIDLKKANHEFAYENLNWEKNSDQIFQIIESTKHIPLDESLRAKIIHYEEDGIRKINKYFLKYFWISNILKRITK